MPRATRGENALENAVARLPRLIENLEVALRGKREVVRLAAVALVARGHLLIEDVPGVGKTTLARGLARSIAARFQRVQFTSDLLPSDVIGVSVYDPTSGEFNFRPGPLFTNILLADEINRGTPKAQSALLEAMEEAQVSVEGSSFPLPKPFMVLATQNPLEHHGTFPLPESELDRFLMRLRIGYPEPDAERTILRSPSGNIVVEKLEPVLDASDVELLSEAAGRVRVTEPLEDYILALVSASRNDPRLRLGVSPRGGQALYRAVQARALLEGRDHALPDDVKALAIPVLAHRIVPAEVELGGERMEAGERAVKALLASVPVPI